MAAMTRHADKLSASMTVRLMFALRSDQQGVAEDAKGQEAGGGGCKARE